MSRSSLSKMKNRPISESSDCQQSLPSREWGSIQKRLEYLESTIIKVQKRALKIQKKLTQTEEDVSSIKIDLKKQIGEMLNSQTNDIAERERELQFEGIKEQLTQLHNFLKRIQKKNHQMFKQFKYNGSRKLEGLGEAELQQKIEEKLQNVLENHYQRSKSYIDRAVAEMKVLVKQYARNDNEPIDSKTALNELSRSLSKSRLSAHQRSHKKFANSQFRLEPTPLKNDTSFEERKEKSPHNVSNNGNSRVSYLREKLKQFQQINKKYDDPLQTAQKRPHLGEGSKKKVEKMKQFKNYLEQSQSQLEQSNLDLRQNELFSGSNKKWRNDHQYRMQ